MVTLVVSKEAVPRPTKLITSKAVVVLITAETDLKVELSHRTVVLDVQPLETGVDHP